MWEQCGSGVGAVWERCGGGVRAERGVRGEGRGCGRVWEGVGV